MDPFCILCSIAVVFIALYYYFTSTFDFWNSRGVRGPRPIPIFGNVKDVLFGKKGLSFYLAELYKTYKDESMIGMFFSSTPILILKDQKLIKDVLITDFSKFADRGFIKPHEKADPLSQHLFGLEPERWRPLRTNLSPVFTSSKLKKMFSLMLECADHLENHVEKLANKKKSVDCYELMAKYTIDVIGTCAFGIEMNAISNEESEFRKIAKEAFNPNWKNLIHRNIRDTIPLWLYNIFLFILPQSKMTKLFIRIVVETLNYREKNNIVRHDIIDALRELKKHPEKLGDIDMTDNFIASQVFIFFLAGFETSAATISYALYELALNQYIQDKLREEINHEYENRGNTLSCDNIKKMNYLDKVFKETLRKYPSGSLIIRNSTTSYTFDGTKVSIPKNTKVWISILAIHHDPSIYPDPDVFDPERFSVEDVKSRHAMSFLPFGDGQRNCIGAQFATYQSKIGLVKMLHNYKFEICEKTQIPCKYSPKAILLMPKHGIHLKITKIK